MKTLCNPYYYCFALLVLFLASVNAFAQTAITSGVSYTTNTTATLWVKPAVNVDWVDAHYNTGGAQQNIRMTYNVANARYEQAMSATPGTVVNYSFTYAISGLAYDTVVFSATVVAPGSSSSSKTSSSIVSSVASSAVVPARLHHRVYQVHPARLLQALRMVWQITAPPPLFGLSRIMLVFLGWIFTTT